MNFEQLNSHEKLHFSLFLLYFTISQTIVIFLVGNYYNHILVIKIVVRQIYSG